MKQFLLSLQAKQRSERRQQGLKRLGPFLQAFEQFGDLDELNRKYGTNLFKCPRFSCKYFTQGFASKKEREGHVQRHERPFRCTDIHCTGSIGFPKEEQLTSHLKETHPDSTNQDAFPTEDEITESQREHVPETAVEPNETPISTTEVPDADADANAESGSGSESDKAAQLAQLSRPAKRTKRRRNSIAFIATKCSPNVLTRIRT